MRPLWGMGAPETPLRVRKAGQVQCWNLAASRQDCTLATNGALWASNALIYDAASNCQGRALPNQIATYSDGVDHLPKECEIFVPKFRSPDSNEGSVPLWKDSLESHQKVHIAYICDSLVP
jgi:hypothetical protein